MYDNPLSQNLPSISSRLRAVQMVTSDRDVYFDEFQKILEHFIDYKIAEHCLKCESFRRNYIGSEIKIPKYEEIDLFLKKEKELTSKEKQDD